MVNKLIRFNDLDLPTPSTYIVEHNDLSHAERNAVGDMTIERVNTKVKIELVWKFLEVEEMQKILNELKKDVLFEVTFVDLDGEVKTKVFYAGTRKANAMDFIDGRIRYRDFSFNIIER